MDPKEFPSLAEANTTSNNGNLEKSTTLGSSWAEVAQPHSNSDSQDVSVPEQESQTQSSTVNHNSDAWEATKQNASFAEIAGHEKRQEEEFPTPQQSLKQVDTEPLPASGGVGDLLPNSTNAPTADPTEPPNPDRSFADVTSNKDFPKPEHDTPLASSDEPSLSDLPDVKDMLSQPSVHVPPVPPAQSFAKVAAKEIPPEQKPLSERAQYIINNQPKEEPLAMTHENFPTLGQSNLMAQENASDEDRAVYAEIERFNQVHEEDEESTKENKDPNLNKSFADITSSNLENAPPAAKSHVDQHPVYDGETVYLENVKREEKKNLQIPHGNNEQLIQEEELKQEEPTKEQKDQEVEKEQVREKSRGIVKEDKKVTRYSVFDTNQTGKITIFQTMAALYRLGYSWIAIIPGALLMHLRLSPLTSPYRAPFIYRSLSDLILLPIYTENLSKALTYKTPMLRQKKEQMEKMVKTYGHKEGLGYWDGLRAMHNFEKDSLKWWQLGLWAIHRIQWSLTYTMLHEPKTKVVTTSTLSYLASADQA